MSNSVFLVLPRARKYFHQHPRTSGFDNSNRPPLFFFCFLCCSRKEEQREEALLFFFFFVFLSFFFFLLFIVVFFPAKLTLLRECSASFLPFLSSSLRHTLFFLSLSACLHSLCSSSAVLSLVVSFLLPLVFPLSQPPFFFCCFVSPQGISFLDVENQLLSTYLTYLSYYILLKTHGISVKDHPVIERLVEVRILLEKIRPIESRLQFQMNRLLQLAAANSARNDKTQQNRTAGGEGDEEEEGGQAFFSLPGALGQAQQRVLPPRRMRYLPFFHPTSVFLFSVSFPRPHVCLHASLCLSLSNSITLELRHPLQSVDVSLSVSRPPHMAPVVSESSGKVRLQSAVV